MNLIVLRVSVMNFARVWILKSLYSLYSSAGAFVYLNATAALLGAEYRSFLKIFLTTSELLEANLIGRLLSGFLIPTRQQSVITGFSSSSASTLRASSSRFSWSDSSSHK